jgi:hypothetical protein
MASGDVTTKLPSLNGVIVGFDVGGFVQPPIGEAEYVIVTSRTTPLSMFTHVTTASSNGSRVSPDAEAEVSAGNVAAIAVVLVTIMASAVVGNLMVVISVLCYDRLRRVANSFIVSLAFADLLVAALVMPFNASQVNELRCTNRTISHASVAAAAAVALATERIDPASGWTTSHGARPMTYSGSSSRVLAAVCSAVNFYYLVARVTGRRFQRASYVIIIASLARRGTSNGLQRSR